MVTDTPFNVALAETRIARDMTVADAASATGFSNSFILFYESSAKNPTAKTMLAFARAYGLRFMVDGLGVTITDTETEVALLRCYQFEDWHHE